MTIITIWSSGFFQSFDSFFTSKLFLLLLQCCHWSMIFLTVTRLLIIRIIILYRTFTLLYWSFGLFCFQDNAFLMKTATWQCLGYVFIFKKCYFLKKKITFESWGRREQIRSGLSFLSINRSLKYFCLSHSNFWIDVMYVIELWLCFLLFLNSHFGLSYRR